MSHKLLCKNYCIEQLKMLNLEKYFNEKEFHNVYRKIKGAQGNAFLVGSYIADYIIVNSKPIFTDEESIFTGESLAED